MIRVFGIHFDASKTKAPFIIPRIYRTRPKCGWNFAWYNFQIGWKWPEKKSNGEANGK